MSSCAYCLSWGMTWAQGACRACYGFAARAGNTIVGECASCARMVRLKKGHCRLCWCQAYLQRPDGPNKMLAPHVRQVRDQQLFLSDMDHRQAAHPTRPRELRGLRHPPKPPPPVAARPCSRYLQPLLFTDTVARDYTRARLDLRSDPLPDNGWLAWGLYLAHTLGETRGWKPAVRLAMQRTLVMLLSTHTEDQMIHTSHFHDLVAGNCTNFNHTVEILTTMGVLHDDRPSTFASWLAASTAALTPAISTDVHSWATALHGGTPRTRARSLSTAYGYLSAIGPALATWSVSYAHLREVTRTDITTYVDARQGHAGITAMSALRSLFSWLRRNKRIFRDPTSQIRGTKKPEALWQPLQPSEIRQTIAAAQTPQARLLVAFAAIHAMRAGRIRTLQISDVDLANRRVQIMGHDRPLDDLTHQLLIAWLDHRRDQWPSTANPHLLISQRTAVGLGPVSAPWANLILRGLPAGLERLRIDRQLDEALASGADPLHIASVFGISAESAIRYAANAAHLLTRPHESGHHSSPPTPGPISDTEPVPPWSSA